MVKRDSDSPGKHAPIKFWILNCYETFRPQWPSGKVSASDPEGFRFGTQLYRTLFAHYISRAQMSFRWFGDGFLRTTPASREVSPSASAPRFKIMRLFHNSSRVASKWNINTGCPKRGVFTILAFNNCKTILDNNKRFSACGKL
ncbi:hypothetical protein AVEN_174918-1 [Araneus ventricosus]|uniref:Uncharacterized protein n=1 Tax=Araneus ventricosus TaxID=182803 RepID=A0A4Y2MDP0_ARAVE|nr:hypothetical protein AVEN_174918-1 [Araneus ventricosus]